MKIKTKSGFQIEFDSTVLNDMEVLDAITEVEAKNMMALSALCGKIFSKEDKKRLYDHLRTSDGRVPIDTLSEEITEIFSLAGTEGKN